jgi:hypothetical protein
MATGRTGKRRTASKADQRRRPDDNVDHPLQAGTLLDAGLIGRYRAERWQPADRSRAVHCSISATEGLAAAPLHPRPPIERVNQTQLLPVLVDVNHIETSGPPRPPAARRHLRGPSRKALATVVLSGVALVIFGGLTPRTLLVIAAAGAIVAAARRYRPKK